VGGIHSPGTANRDYSRGADELADVYQSVRAGGRTYRASSGRGRLQAALTAPLRCRAGVLGNRGRVAGGRDRADPAWQCYVDQKVNFAQQAGAIAASSTRRPGTTSIVATAGVDDGIPAALVERGRERAAVGERHSDA
jgi:hypothetical protein